MKPKLTIVIVVAAVVVIAGLLLARGLGGHGPEARIVDGAGGKDWAAYGRTYGEQHYSPLTQINAQSVGQLGLAWSMDLPPANTVTQPLAVDGVIYFAVGYSVVHAVDARSGKQLWQYDPEVGKVAAEKMRKGWGSRGLAWWDGKIYTGTADGRLIALDAKTGRPLWSVQTLSNEDLSYITGAPRVFDGKVIIGFAGADAGAVRGYVTAYDAGTGKQLWRFYTVPGDPAKGFENKAMEMAAKTWTGEWWKLGGGGTVWNAITYDKDLDTVLIGVSNGSPWNHKIRSPGGGDNLFLASIVALDAKTGAYKWHYQVNPGESWDYVASMDITLADLKIGGQDRKVLLHAPKNGFFYVIDRTNGKVISAEPFAEATWASKIDLKTGRPVENPASRFPDGGPFLMRPSSFGAHTWLPMAFSPKSGLTYIPVSHIGMMIGDKGLDTTNWKKWPKGGFDMRVSSQTLDEPSARSSDLLAWDPVQQKAAWRVKLPGPSNGGVMATAGDLVFQGQIDGTFNAYDAGSGRKLWSFATQAPVLGPPMTFEAGGQQYVTVITGMGTATGALGPLLGPYDVNFYSQARRVLTFALGAKATLPAAPRNALTFPADPDFKPTADVPPVGAQAFGQFCVVCHGQRAVSAGTAPDLRASTIPQSREAFYGVVRGGGLTTAGMPQFANLDDATLDAIQLYIRSEAAKARASQAAGGKPDHPPGGARSAAPPVAAPQT